MIITIPHRSFPMEKTLRGNMTHTGSHERYEVHTGSGERYAFWPSSGMNWAKFLIGYYVLYVSCDKVDLFHLQVNYFLYLSK